MPRKKRILVMRFSALGDAAMLAPVVKELIKQHPDTSIYVASRPMMKAIFNQIKEVNFIPIDFDKDYKGLLGIFKLYRKLKSYNFSEIADCHNVLRTKVIDCLFKNAGKKVAVLDKGRSEKKELIDQKNKNLRPLKPMTERYADIFRSLGYSLELSHELKSNFSKEPKSIGIAPFAKFESKTFPLKRMKEIVLKLAENGYQIYLFGGGKKESGILHNWEKMHENIHSLAGKMTFHEELEKIANLEIMLSMDSANMHLASLMGTRVISFWGGTHPFAGFLGYGQSMNDVIQDENLTIRPTSIYGKDPKKFTGYDYFQNLDTNTVVEEILHKL